MRWTQDKTLKFVWDCEDVEDVMVTIRKRGPSRFRWSVSCEFAIEDGIDDVGGVAPTLERAKDAARKALMLLESEP